MTSLTLNLTDELVERLAKAAKDEGVSVEKIVTRLVEGALDDDGYELDDEEKRAVDEGIADMKAGRWISHEEMMQELKAQRGR